MTKETVCTSIPRAHTSVVISTRLKEDQEEGSTHTHTHTHTHMPPFSSSKLLHDSIPLLLGHVSMHGRHSEVSFSHLFCEPFNLFIMAITTANSDSHRCTYMYAYICAHTHTHTHTQTHTHTPSSLCCRK